MRRAIGIVLVFGLVFGLAGVLSSSASETCQGVDGTAARVCILSPPDGMGIRVTIQDQQSQLVVRCFPGSLTSGTWWAYYDINTPVVNLGGSGADLLPATTLPVPCPPVS